MTGVSGLGSLTFQLTRSRFAARQGESLLYLAAILAYAVASAVALTVAGGTWMFYNRWQNPTGVIADAIAEDATFDLVPMFYFVLALIACALLVPSIIGLAAGAAVLGARGRERRLAALRLLGLSSGDVTRMTLLDTALQAAIGTVIGLAVYLLTVPAWGALEMIGMAVQPGEMSLPWWLVLGLGLGLVVLGLISAAWGLRLVRITPLGVARRASQPGLKAWRVVLFVVVVFGAAVVMPMLQLGREVTVYVVLAAGMAFMIAAMNVAGPWFLQQLARLFAQAPLPSVMWAGRRVQAAPKTTWRRVAGVGILALIGGYVALMPVALNGGDSEATQSIAESALWDFTKGVIITLAVGFLLTATSILIAQASAVFERAEQSVAMHKMGASNGFLSRVSWLETLGPLVLASGIGAGLGAGMAYPMVQFAGALGVGSGLNFALIGSVLIAGLILAAAALAACEPLQRQVVTAERRRND